MTGRYSRRRWLAASGGILLAPLLASCGTNAQPSGIYIVPEDGAPRWIGSGVGAPAWSPAGDAVVWGDETGLWQWREEEAALSRIVDTSVVARPAWAPDASAIAFVDARSATLQRVAPDGVDLLPLATIAANAGAASSPLMKRGGPAWSPDGKTIAFVCWDGGGDELCLVDAEGSRRQEITSLGQRAANGATPPAGSSVVGMAWSPDSTQLAVGVQGEQRGATAGVFLVELAVRTGRRLSTLIPNSPMSWQAASGAILFSAARDGRSDAYLLDPLTQNARPLTAALPDGVRDPVMSEQGQLAAVRGDELVLVDGDAQRLIAVETLAVSNPVWNPAGSMLAVTAAQTPINNYR
ncbi:MAG: hypothetical protein QM692_15925 [Thermomicrobiales bacterium]